MIGIMSDDLIAKLRELGGIERGLERGSFLFHRGDPVKSVFGIVDGAAELVRRQENGNSLVLQRATSGTVLAEGSIYSEFYHCEALASEDATFLVVAKSKLREHLKSDPGFAELWATYLARQVQKERFRSEVLALRTVAERLDMWLNWHDTDTPLRGQWSTVAREIGVSPEALYRELAKRRS